jgi:hypothetical protein
MLKVGSAGAAVAFLALFLTSTTALADDWTAVKLRGLVLGLFDGEWVKLERGAVVPGDQAIRTMRSGRVTFQRGEESIDLGPDTQVQIIDRAGYDKYTTVKQYYGQVAVEAEVRDVTHFAVETPHLAAVVKGTRFVVVSGDKGATVRVDRGAVAVADADNNSMVVVGAGQQASALPGGFLSVSGHGNLPQVVDARGKPLHPKAVAAQQKASGANAASGAASRGASGLSAFSGGATAGPPSGTPGASGAGGSGAAGGAGGGGSGSSDSSPGNSSGKGRN